MSDRLKAPFPWFGGKSRVAALVWRYLGEVNNYIEPFAGSLAVLLARPHPPRVETVNDLDCYVSNFWRATSQDPEAVAIHADWPVNEADLHARHRWLVLSEEAGIFRQRIRRDPHYFDAALAGWWCWGLCCWIGAGWCAVPGETEGEVGAEQERRPVLGAPRSAHGQGVHALAQKLPQLSGSGAVDGGAAGIGVHAQPHKRPRVSRGTGVGQLAQGALSCADRRAWLLDWFGRLRDRLRTVRVCCGDWSRVCSSESVTVGLGTTGVFLDPPYGKLAKRYKGLYATDSLSVADAVRAWCLEWGQQRAMRIALCGYAGEGHEVLEEQGWTCIAWRAHGGYGNRSETGRANARKERIWFSPHCQTQRSLFDPPDTLGEHAHDDDPLPLPS